MPFTCKFQLNNGILSPTDEVEFISFIGSSFGNFHSENIRIANILYNGKKAYIVSTCPCFPSSTNKQLIKGQKIDEATAIAYFSANGEDIPYDKPYAKIEMEK